MFDRVVLQKNETREIQFSRAQVFAFRVRDSVLIRRAVAMTDDEDEELRLCDLGEAGVERRFFARKKNIPCRRNAVPLRG